MNRDEELEVLRKWKSAFIKAMCKYDCNSIDEIYQQGRADMVEELKSKADCENTECYNCAMSDGDLNCMLGKTVK